MASNIPRIRLVRCPKCNKHLTEIAEVPVYQCGGCGTVLRAKSHAATVGGRVNSGSLENNSQNLSGSNSMNRESISVVKQTVPLRVDGGVERLASSALAVSNSSTANSPDQMEECSHLAEKGIEGRRSHDPRPEEHISLGRSEKNIEAKSETEGRIQVEQRHSVDEQREKSMHPSPDCGSSTSIDKVEQSSKYVHIDATLTEGDVKLAAGSSHSYDGSASSPDRIQENRLPHKYLLLSKRTFRRKKGVDPADSVEKEANVQGQKLPEKLSDGRSVSAIYGSFQSNRDELPSRCHIPTMERDTTFGSEDFHSVQNWIGSESEGGALKFPSEDLPLHNQNDKPSTKVDFLEPDHMRILRKVDELRDELSGFLSRTVEEKRASHFRHRFSHIPFSSQPPCSPCSPHPHDMDCHANLPSYIQKAQTEDQGVYKLHHRENKQAVKSYSRPVSGGAPFVICYKCWKLLQLPADFLVTQKRLHKLRCGSCSEILVFSFRPRVHTAPMTPMEAGHPPSEVDNSNNRTGWDPISYSDDYGISFAQSYSSEAEPVLPVSRNSSYSIEGRDTQQVRGSRLHCLMGYSSASELLFRPRGVDEGYESTEPSTPQFYRPSEEDMRFRLNETGTITPCSVEIEESESQERLRTRRRSLALQGLLKKGVRELSQGLESVKLKIHSNG